MGYSKIVGLGHHVPETVITDEYLVSIMYTCHERIVAQTGNYERRLIDRWKDGVWNMAANATRMVRERAGCSYKDIGLIVFAPITPDYFFSGSGEPLLRELSLEG